MTNPKLTNFYRQLFFALLCLIGISYVFLLLILSQKIYSGFIMQLIFLVSRSPLSFGHVAVGVVWIALLVRLFQSFLRSTYHFLVTRGFVRSLAVTRITGLYSVFESSKPLALTVGLFRPRIFLSSSLVQLSTSKELVAIIYHEECHRLHLDPAKDFLLDFIFNSLPPFPLKFWLFGQYRALVEISCDAFSCSRTLNRTALVSALVKTQEARQTPSVLVSYFSAQSERIRVLVGQKKQFVTPAFVVSLALVGLLFVSASSLSRSDIFYQCRHLFRCFQNIFVPDVSAPRPVYIDHQCHLSSS